MHLDVARLRADTPGCERVVHLNNAGSSLPPDVVVETVVTHLRREAEIGGYEAHAEAAERIDGVYDSVADLLGTQARNIAQQESATAAWHRALLSVPFEAGDRVLVATSEYASNVLPLLQLVGRLGVTVEFVPDGADGALDPAALRSMLDERVRLVAVTHAPSQNGLVNDAAGVGRVLRDTGSDAWYLLDACQSVGQLPVDVSGIGCDFLSATGRKFLRGPRGTGFLYASDRALALEPYPLDLHSATWTGDASYAVADTARRYELWERSYAGLLGLGAAVDYARALGVDRLRDRIRSLTERARAGLAEVPGVVVRDRGSERGGIVTLTHDRVAAADIVGALRSLGINTSLSTPEYALQDFTTQQVDALVRVSPHAYNTEAEIDRLVAAVADVTR
ncbi:MAG: aminotransferase class V-fold PLP-dependent enzyme [Candidatus Nanopelagicales bacterium]